MSHKIGYSSAQATESARTGASGHPDHSPQQFLFWTILRKKKLCDVHQIQHLNGWVTLKGYKRAVLCLGGDNDVHARMLKRFVWCAGDALV
jgi:hypothetical protein